MKEDDPICGACWIKGSCSPFLSPQMTNGLPPISAAYWDYCRHYSCGLGRKAARIAWEQALRSGEWSQFAVISNDRAAHDTRAVGFFTPEKQSDRIVDQNGNIFSYSAEVEGYCPTGQRKAI